MVRCACGREFNASKVKACPVCGAFARFAKPVSVSSASPVSSTGKAASLTSDEGLERRMLSELEKQTALLKSLRIGVFVFMALILLNFLILPGLLR